MHLIDTFNMNSLSIFQVFFREAELERTNESNNPGGNTPVAHVHVDLDFMPPTAPIRWR